jgi:hypothetical protein
VAKKALAKSKLSSPAKIAALRVALRCNKV